jgi:hypothetical protein
MQQKHGYVTTTALLLLQSARDRRPGGMTAMMTLINQLYFHVLHGGDMMHPNP